MSPVELAYLAGLIDGEGSITLTRNRSNEHRRVVLGVTSTTREIIDLLLTQVGGHCFTIRKKKEHHKQAWNWVLGNHAALEFLETVVTHMHEPSKIARIQLLLSQYNNVTKKNGKYSAEELEAKLQFEKLFFTL